MMRRSLLKIPSHRSVRRVPRQIPFSVSSSHGFSSANKPFVSPKHNSMDEPPKSGSSLSKIALGGVVVGVAGLAAYQTGFMDQIIGRKEKQSSVQEAELNIDKRNEQNVQHLEKQLDSLNNEEIQILDPVVDHAKEKVEIDSYIPHSKTIDEEQVGSQSQVEDNSNIEPAERNISLQEKDLAEDVGKSVTEPDFQKTNSRMPFEGRLNSENTTGPDEVIQTTPPSDESVPENSDIGTLSSQYARAAVKSEDTLDEGTELPTPLLDTYHLLNKVDTTLDERESDEDKISKETEDLITSIEGLNDGYISKDGKLVIDFLQAIHAAEKRQGDLDAHVFSEEKKALKEKYEKELKDARARELMHAEEAAILDKELKRERVKATAALKSLQEKLEEKSHLEIKQKEKEAELELTKVKELAKAELSAAIAKEKASQIEKIGEANLHINALCMAFYARSEEARQSHSAQKLALGALALEDALSSGLPIQAEIEGLRANLQGIDKDSKIELVLSSIPEEILFHGTDTLLQLNHKFDVLKAALRHFTLIPPGGGGILTHSLAYVASWLKVKENDIQGNGIESVINRVESYLAEGKLQAAADSLEEGVKGTNAADIVGDWVSRARNRAITEQALTLLQSYATSMTLT